MDDAVRAEYESILAEVIIDQGDVVVREDSQTKVYDWVDRSCEVWSEDYTSRWCHTAQCPVVAHGTPTEVEWEEFEGSFAENSQRAGVELPGVSCQCGKLADRVLRLEISARDLTEAAFSKLHYRSR